MKTKMSIGILLIVTFMITAMPLPGQEIPVTTNSKEAKKIFLQGRDKLENSQTLAATKLFDQAITVDPSFALAHLYRAQTGGDAEVVRKHREHVSQLINTVSEGERHLIQHVFAGADGKAAESKAELDKLLTMFPKDKRVHVMHAMYFVSMEKPMEAADALNKAIELDKKYAPAYNLLGYTRMDQNNWVESEKAFKKYIELQPDNPNPYDSYADMLLKSGKLDDALTNFKKAYSVDQTFISSLGRIGLVEVLKGDFDAARESYRQLYEKAPSYNWKMVALNGDAESYLHEGKYDEAVKKFEDVKTFAAKEKQDNGVINAVADIAWIQVDNGKISEASASLKAARELTETSDIPESYRENQRFFRDIERIHFLLTIDELETAENLLAKTKQQVDEKQDAVKTGIYHTLVGILERHKGDYNKSLESFSKSSPDDPYAMYQKALTQEAMGDVDAATNTYKEVVNYNFGGMPYAMVRYHAKEKLEVGLVTK
jgi:tetratricopeptide (TPR) repeat protein